MSWPAPQPGLAIRYSYLWHREALAGQEEGTKDRPCAIVLAVREQEGRMRVYALPITHVAPGVDDEAIEIPATVKARLGRDSERSWIVVNEANVFSWPGPDLRFLPGKGPESAAHGVLPPGLFRDVPKDWVATAEAVMPIPKRLLVAADR